MRPARAAPDDDEGAEDDADEAGDDAFDEVGEADEADDEVCGAAVADVLSGVAADVAGDTGDPVTGVGPGAAPLDEVVTAPAAPVSAAAPE